MTGHPYVPRVNEGGNFCGHDPLNPSFTLKRPAKTGKGGIPRVLTLCMKRITDYYDNPRKKIPSLDLVNGSPRQQRSERRESCTCLLACLLSNTEVVSLRTGVPTEKGFINFTVDFLANYSGLTMSRTERALHDLKAAGLVTVSQARKTLADGSIRGVAAVKVISKQVFRLFGLGVMLDIERKKARKRLKAKQDKWRKDKAAQPTTETEKARYAVFFNAVAKQIDLPVKSSPQRSLNGSYQALQESNLKKQIALRAMQIRKQLPHLSCEQCYVQAERQLRGLTSTS